MVKKIKMTKKWILFFVLSFSFSLFAEKKEDNKLSPSTAEAEILSQLSTTVAVQGVSDNEVVFGQSAALSGISKNLGIDMRAGLQAAFQEVNKKGGVSKRRLRLITRDDGYESELAVRAVQHLIEKDKVFSLVGGVGTPTSKAVVPIVARTPLLYIGPFTGASFLRKSYTDTVINMRASYAQETKEMVLRLKKDLNIRRIGVLYQNDSYGLDGLNGVRKATKEVKGIKIVSLGNYTRNTVAIKTALLNIRKGNPQAIIIIGAYAPVARFVKWAEKLKMKSMVFLSVSFVGASALAAELKNSKANIYVTQTVPFPKNKTSPLIKKYQAAMKASKNGNRISFVSLEGYIVGRLVIKALARVGENLTHKTFTDAFKQAKNKFNIDGFPLHYDELNDNQGSDQVFLTKIYKNKIIPVKRLTRFIDRE